MWPSEARSRHAPWRWGGPDRPSPIPGPSVRGPVLKPHRRNPRMAKFSHSALPLRASLPRRKHPASGFTLIEALAALMLIAIVLPVAIRAVAQSSAIGLLADRRAEAIALADVRLTEVLLGRDWQFGDEAGTFDADDGEHAWRYRWALRVDEVGSTAFRQITVRVTWQQRGREQSVSLVTRVDVERS